MIGEHLFLPPYMALKHIISHTFLYIAHNEKRNRDKNLEPGLIYHQFWHAFWISFYFSRISTFHCSPLIIYAKKLFNITVILKVFEANATNVYIIPTSC
jgi:hypothetical protein